MMGQTILVREMSMFEGFAERVHVEDQVPRPGHGGAARIPRQFGLTPEEDGILNELQQVRGDRFAVTTLRWVLQNLVAPYIEHARAATELPMVEGKDVSRRPQHG